MATGTESEHELHIDRRAMLKSLEENGYAVVPDVCPAHDCNRYMSQYHDWLSQFGEERPLQMESIIQAYYIGHFENTWNARMKTKPVFASLWGTEKLLTSFDGVAISRPPESTKNGSFDKGDNWFHVDQSTDRKGLHAYQGALYLEETSENDYCFRVVAGSHNFLDEFYSTFRGDRFDYFAMEDRHIAWFREKGCIPKKIPVPKGGMVLWDSRTIHDNCKPLRDRSNSNRWRCVVFVCMTPARWAQAEDLENKKIAYRQRMMTSHWPSQGVSLFDVLEPRHENDIRNPIGKNLPDIAKTPEAMLVSGMMAYDFEDGESNGPDWSPEWKGRQ